MSTQQREIIWQDCERIFQGINDPDAFGELDGSAILIAGGTGFIGSWLGLFSYYVCQKLKIRFKCYIVGRDKQRFQERFGHCGSGIEFIRSDVRNITEIPRDVNYVVNAAAVPDNRFYMSNPMEAMTTIGGGTAALLRAADRVSNLRRIVHLSSGSVYGPQAEEVHTISEDGPINGNILGSVHNVYVEAKRYAEMLCVAARSELRLPISLVRPFTFIGPFQALDAPWAINNFINDGLSGRSIRILSDGKAVRGFLYGADAAGWLLKLLTRAKSDQTYNIGSNFGMTLGEIAQRVAANFQPSPEVVLNASLVPGHSIARYLPDVRKITSEFGLHEYTDLDTAIKQTIRWHKLAGNT